MIILQLENVVNIHISCLYILHFQAAVHTLARTHTQAHAHTAFSSCKKLPGYCTNYKYDKLCSGFPLKTACLPSSTSSRFDI